jgi:hypothetical protein
MAALFKSDLYYAREATNGQTQAIKGESHVDERGAERRFGELERMSLRSSRGGALLWVDGLPSVSAREGRETHLSSPSGPKTGGESIATIHRALELGIN